MFLCAQVGISPEPREENAAYLVNWLAALKDDNRCIFTAASAAQKAVGYLDGLQPQRPSTSPATAEAESGLAL